MGILVLVLPVSDAQYLPLFDLEHGEPYGFFYMKSGHCIYWPGTVTSYKRKTYSSFLQDMKGPTFQWSQMMLEELNKILILLHSLHFKVLRSHNVTQKPISSWNSFVCFFPPNFRYTFISFDQSLFFIKFY